MALDAFPAELVRDHETVARLDPTRVLLTFLEPPPRPELARLLEELGLAVEDDEAVNHTDHRVWVRVTTGEFDDERLQRASDALGPRLRAAGAVYRMANTRDREAVVCPLPDVLLVRFRDDASAGARREVELQFGMTQDEGDRDFAENLGAQAYWRYIITDPATTAYRLRSAVREIESVQEVRYEHMPMVSPYAMQLVDPLCAQQWNMERIVAQGAGPGTITGWDYSLGDSSIVIAVLDTGCDLDHPDLRFMQGLSFGNPTGYGETQAVTGYAAGHGTLCAGVAAATANNLKGLAGVAGRCVILPVAFQTGSDYEFFRGLIFAADRGARVASMSFSIYDEVWDTSLTSQAVTYADKRGVVMCAASGNGERDFMSYPASDSRVIAVGGSTRSLPEDRVSKGAGYAYGSNYGGGLSVVAPGVEVPTTCVQGTGTGGTWGADYASGFFGTSAATPHVAGLAALILSARPGLSPARVKAIIESTADKIGAEPFVRSTNGTWNKYVGYGRINVLRAMRKTFAPFDIVARLEALHLLWLAKAIEAHSAEIARLESGDGADPWLVEVHRSWVRLGQDEGILRLIREVIEVPELLEEIRNDPRAVAESWGIWLPDRARVSAEGGAGGDGSQPMGLTVVYPVGDLLATAGWHADSGFFGEVETFVEPRDTVEAVEARDVSIHEGNEAAQ